MNKERPRALPLDPAGQGPDPITSARTCFTLVSKALHPVFGGEGGVRGLIRANQTKEARAQSKCA
jgi:hypothetical protein